MKKKITALLLAAGMMVTSVNPSAAEVDFFTDGAGAEFESSGFDASAVTVQPRLPETDNEIRESNSEVPETLGEMPEVPKSAEEADCGGETEAPEFTEETSEPASAGEYSISISEKEIHLSYDRKAIDDDIYNSQFDYMEAQAFVDVTNTGIKTVHLKTKMTRCDGSVYTGTLTLKPGESESFEYHQKWGHYAGIYTDVFELTDESGQIHEQIKYITTVTGPRDMFDIENENLKFKTKYDGAEAVEKQKITIVNTSEESYSPIAFSDSSNSAFEISQCSPKVLKPGETGTFTISGKKDFLDGYYEERIRICTSAEKKDYKLMQAAIRFLPKITKIQPVESITYQNARPLDLFFLPNAELLISGGKSKSAKVDWDIENCGYNPKKTKEQTLTVHGTVILPENVGNPDNLSLKIQMKVIVSGYKKVGIPVLKEAEAWGDYVSIPFSKEAENAARYRLLIGKTPDFREKKQYVYSFWSEYAYINPNGCRAKNVAPGHYYCAVKAVNQKNGQNVYGGWSNMLEFDIEPKKPETPVIKSAAVSGNAVSFTMANIPRNMKYKGILSLSSKPPKPSDNRSADRFTTGNLTGKTTKVEMDGLPKGTYYFHVESYYEERVSNGVQTWHSDWAKPKKIVIRYDCPEAAQEQYKVYPSGALRVTIPPAAGAEGYEMWIGKAPKLMYYDQISDNQYILRETAFKKAGSFQAGQKNAVITVRNLPKGSYTLMVRQYKTYGGKKYYSKWCKGKSDVIIK